MVAVLRFTQPTSTQIRVIVANMPEVMLRLAVQIVQAQPDMRVVHVAHDLVELLAATKNADLVLMGAKVVYPAPGVVSHLLSEFPFVRVIVLSPQSDLAAGYWLGLRHLPALMASSHDLLGMIRSIHNRDVMD